MIKNKNTSPEIIAQKLLDELGILFTTHEKTITGTPDIFIEQLKLVIFIHGCFWHKHSCLGEKNIDEAVIKKDTITIERVIKEGYKPIIFWECELVNDQIATKNRLRYLVEKIKFQQQKI